MSGPSVKLHPHGLLVSLRVCRDSQTASVSYTARHDNDRVTAPAGVSSGASALLGASDAEALAAAAMFAYLHELGEHIIIDGINLNQHCDGGVRTQIRLLKSYVLPWMQRILHQDTDRNEQYPPAPTEFVINEVTNR